ncbi:MAG: OST-HTH/LOTUS domain-containing protein, partial [Thermomonas sp.]
VSSDSDFTRLAQRLREEGLTVYGFGEHKTPDPFVQACDKFIYTEVLRAEAPEPAATAKPAAEKPAAKPKPAPEPAPAPAPPAKAGPLPVPLDLLRQAIEEASDDEGWAHLGAMGTYLNKIRPNFDPRLYGQKKLSDLLRKHPRHFSVIERESGGGGKALYVKALG